MKPKSLVIAGQRYGGESVPGPCTHRLSHYGSWPCPSHYRLVRMPMLHASLHSHLSPIVMINSSSRRELLLNLQNLCRSIPAWAENSSLSRLCYRRL
ncbi:hypothetical protein R6Q59_006901 [Mikania micrantha]